MSEHPLRLIHVGTAGRGAWPLEVASGDPRWESVALVDVNPNALAAAREKTELPESACFSDIGAALSAVEADAAVLCTPTVTHAPFARAAFEKGVHVLTEKGMTLDWRLALELVQEAEEAGVRFCVAQNYRYFPTERTVQAMLGSEQYGDAAFLDMIHHRHRPEPRTLNYRNAMMWDMSCHHFDNFVYWFGRAQSVIARTFGAPWSKYAPHDANVSAILTFENGVTATYCLTHVAQNGHHRTFIHTTRGTLRCHDVPGVEFRPTNSREAEAVPLLDVPRAEKAVLDDFRRHITEGVEPGISGRHNLQTLAIIEACARSHERQAAVEIAELFA